MSSDDDSGFDKEAEREKLREKYEQDQRDRENTQRMSELLLQGATMTGKHCDQCGDPIFRYDGQEFCPTCQHEAEASAEATEPSAEQSPSEGGEPDAADGATADQPSTDAQATEQPDVDQPATGRPEADQPAADQPAGDEPRVEINDVRVADRHADTSNLRRPPSQTGGDRRSSPESRRGGRDRTSASSEPTRDAGGNARRGRDPHAGSHAENVHSHSHAEDSTDRVANADGLGPAREALVRNLTDLARRAEETDDVARVRELLAATREAAEALEALDRANR